MTELQAGFAAAQLTRLENIASTRSHNGNLLGEKIAGIPGIVPHGIDAGRPGDLLVLHVPHEPEEVEMRPRRSS